MVRRVRISVIGPQPPVHDLGFGQTAVDGMIEFWETKFDSVLSESPDLIVVPEMCDVYPSASTRDQILYYAAREDQILDYFSEIARLHHCYLTYPALREVGDGSWRNSLRLIDRSGDTVGIYDKNYPTITEIDQNILPGDKVVMFDSDFGKIGAALCFDLNFDQLRTSYASERPDVVIFSSVYHGGLMQRYWAYSCRAHLVSAVGSPERAPSSIVSPVGETLVTTTNYFDFATTEVNLDCILVHLDYNRRALSEMKSSYGAQVTITDPGYLGSVLVTNESDSRSVDDLVKEFNLEPLDYYFKRSLDRREQSLST